MAHRVTCKICGRRVPFHDSYVVRIDVFAEPSTPPLDTSDPANDPKEVLHDLVKQIAGMTSAELEEQVFKRIEFRICGRCQPYYIQNPLPVRSTRPSRN